MSELVGGNVLAKRVPTAMYYYNGLPWVPHYSSGGVYVAPGNRYMTQVQLIARGAQSETVYLWPRGWMR